MSVVGEMKNRIKELEAENKKLKEENNSMIAAIYQIRQWTYIAFQPHTTDTEVPDETSD